MLNSAWKKARVRAHLPQVRVHDLKHTFGHRLRSAEVSFEDRQVLLGHKTQSVTTHYSAAELGNLIHAANKVCEVGKHYKSAQKKFCRCRSRKSRARKFAGSKSKFNTGVSG